jgi:hypothetical protein
MNQPAYFDHHQQTSVIKAVADEHAQPRSGCASEEVAAWK